MDRLVVKSDDGFEERITDSVETALKLGNGRIIVHILGKEDIRMSEARSCCGIAYPELAPRFFRSTRPRACARSAMASGPCCPWTRTRWCRTEP